MAKAHSRPSQRSKIGLVLAAEIAARYTAGETADELAIAYGISRATVYNWLPKVGATLRTVTGKRSNAFRRKSKSQQQLTDGQELEVAALYDSGTKPSDLCERYGISLEVLWAIRRRQGVAAKPRSRPRLPLNEAVFDNAESSEAAAYWVGMLMADGHISDAGSITLGLAGEDRPHVEEFRAFLGSGHTIRHIEGGLRPNSLVPGGPPMLCQPQGILSVRSRRLANALARYGVVPRKSLTAEVNVLESNKHFWRGMVCGDGAIVRASSKRAGYSIGLAGSRKIVEQFCKFCYAICGSGRQPVLNRAVWQVFYSGQMGSAIIRELFCGCTLALPRKLALAQQSLAIANKQHPVGN